MKTGTETACNADGRIQWIVFLHQFSIFADFYTYQSAGQTRLPLKLAPLVPIQVYIPGVS